MNRFRYPTRRVAYDIFHGDPFKINSYNFRYADKPIYPPQQYQRPAPQPERKPSFQTFFVNPNFSRGSELPLSNRNAATSRPRFLQEFQACFTPPLRTMAPQVARQPSVPVSPQLRTSSAVTDSPLLRTCCHMGEYQSLRSGQSNATLDSASSCSLRATLADSSSLRATLADSSSLRATLADSSSLRATLADSSSLRATLADSLFMRATGGASPIRSDTTFTRSSNVKLQPKRERDASSGCEININICSRDRESEADNNVSIRIGADACLLNNTDTVRPELKRVPQRSDDSLTDAFGIDKRLSKFNVTETKPRTSPVWERQQREFHRREKARELARERERQYREELELEQERELQKERERTRQRDREREQLRQQDRQRDLEHLRELEAVRERQRLEELKRESQRHREYHRMCMFREHLYRQQTQQQPVQAVPVPIALPVVPPMPIPVSMTSHLYTVTSDDRLPRMAFCDLHSQRRERMAASRRSEPAKKADSVVQEMPPVCASASAETPISQNLILNSSTPSCSTILRSASPDLDSKPTPTLDKSTSSRSLYRSETVPEIPESLDCSSSSSSNDNVHVIDKSSGSLLRGSPAQPQNEAKQLNGRPPIVTRLNNIPIRITTSRQADRNLDIRMNHVRVRGLSPVGTRGPAGSHRHPHVNMNLFPDRLRMMRT